MDITHEIINTLGLDPTLQLKREIRGYKGITVYTLISAIISSSTLDEAANLLGYKSKKPVKDAVAVALVPILDRTPKFNGGLVSWRNLLLGIIEYKYCSECGKSLPYSYFGKNMGKSNNLRTNCKNCHTFKSKEQKVDIKVRTPSWANLDKIRSIYENCPEGMHVDHIIPLRGKLVSGLHVENNLQYLFEEDNLKKNNSFNID